MCTRSGIAFLVRRAAGPPPTQTCHPYVTCLEFPHLSRNVASSRAGVSRSLAAPGLGIFDLSSNYAVYRVAELCSAKRKRLSTAPIAANTRLLPERGYRRSRR